MKTHGFFISSALELDFLERDARRKASRNKLPE
jgi:hypothetical protein